MEDHHNLRHHQHQHQQQHSVNVTNSSSSAWINPEFTPHLNHLDLNPSVNTNASSSSSTLLLNQLLHPSDSSHTHMSAAAAAAAAASSASHVVNSQLNSSISSSITVPDHPLCQGLECYPDGLFVAVEVVTVLLASGGFLGNGLTVLAILTSSLSNNLNGILIGNLSFASVLYCSLVLPMQALAFHHRGWVLSPHVCVAAAAIRVWLIGVTMCLLSAIAVYRFIHVVYPHSYRKWSERRIFYPIIIFCWTFALFFCLGPMWGWGSYRFESPILQCTFNSLHQDKTHKITVVTIGYVIPCVFICVCYAKIGCVVFRSRRRALRGSLHGRKNRRRGSLRLTTMMLLIFIGFFLGTTPYFTINVLDPRHRKPLLHVWAPCAAWLLYCLNPVIYTVMDNNFQQAYRQLLCCKVCTEGDVLRHVNSLRSQQSSI